MVLSPGGPPQAITTTLSVPAGAQSLRLRINVVADLDDGMQSWAPRVARWDNVVLRPL